MPSLRGRYVLIGLAPLALALLLTASSSAATGRVPTIRMPTNVPTASCMRTPPYGPLNSPPDTTPPVTTDDADGLWHPSSETVHFAATDTQSTVAATYYRTDGGAWVKGSLVTLSVWKRGGDNGIHMIDYYSVDSAGNSETPKSCLIKLDSQPPQTTDTSDGLWYQFSETVHFNASDVTVGVAVTHYRIDGGQWLTGRKVTLSVWKRGGNNGIHTIEYYSIDNAGNVESPSRTA